MVGGDVRLIRTNYGPPYVIGQPGSFGVYRGLYVLKGDSAVDAQVPRKLIDKYDKSNTSHRCAQHLPAKRCGPAPAFRGRLCHHLQAGNLGQNPILP